MPRALCLDQWIAGRLARAGLLRDPSEASFTTALRAWQALALADTLRLATAHSPHYRPIAALARELEQELASATRTGTAGAAVHNALPRLPFTWPEMLAARPGDFLAVSQTEAVGVISLPSSGTTGFPKRIYSTVEDMENTVEFFAAGMRHLAAPGERVAMLMSGEREGSVGRLFSRAMRRAGIQCRVLGFPSDDPEWKNTLERLRPRCMVALPGHALALARSDAAGSLARTLRTVLLSGDAASGSVKNAIAETFGAEVFLHYGLTEAGLAGAVECHERSGCHMREADLLVEIIDEQGHAHAPWAADGAATPWGEVVITTLTRRAMPLLRYRTGDEGRIRAALCPCGSRLLRLDVRGRMDQALPLFPSGFGVRLDELEDRFCHLPFVRDYHITATYADRNGGTLREIALALLVTGNAPVDTAALAYHSVRELLRTRPGTRDAALQVAVSKEPPHHPPPGGKRHIRHVLADNGPLRTGKKEMSSQQERPA